ncbi:MAG TPA: hypothetical protein VK509_02545, partial [Polyangiales bacterium]|nr:hypothetical protein [Polyangiales bacterium]
MSARRDPTRLGELAAELPELRAAIRGVRAEQATSARLAALAERLAPQLDGSAPPASGTGSSFAPWAKPALGLSLLLALGGGAYFATRARPPDASAGFENGDEKRISRIHVESRAVEPAAVEPATAEPAAIGSAGIGPAVTGPVRTAVSATQPVSARPGRVRTAADELALLERARAALDADAAVVLALAA